MIPRWRDAVAVVIDSYNDDSLAKWFEFPMCLIFVMYPMNYTRLMLHIWKWDLNTHVHRTRKELSSINL